MIFVTVGTQLPFDRLVRGMDRWAAAHERQEVIAQMGPTDYRPEHLIAHEFLDAGTFRGLVEDCQVLVAHAGIGSILTALDLGKPVLVMPRRASLGEHRNDHQLATVRNFTHLSQVHVVENEDRLIAALDTLLARDTGLSEAGTGCASAELLSTVRAFLEQTENGFSHAT